MTLPENLTNDPVDYAHRRARAAAPGQRKRGPSNFAKDLPKTWRLSDKDVRAAGVTVCRMAPEQAEELLSMLGITQHLNDGEQINVTGALDSFDRRKRS